MRNGARHREASSMMHGSELTYWQPYGWQDQVSNAQRPAPSKSVPIKAFIARRLGLLSAPNVDESGYTSAVGFPQDSKWLASKN